MNEDSQELKADRVVSNLRAAVVVRRTCKNRQHNQSEKRREEQRGETVPPRVDRLRTEKVCHEKICKNSISKIYLSLFMPINNK